MSRQSLLAIRRGRRAARTFTFDSDILPSSPMEANANLTLTLALMRPPDANLVTVLQISRQ